MKKRTQNAFVGLYLGCRATIRVAAMSAIGLLAAHCTMQSPVDDTYYAGTDKIAGGNPPSIPTVTYTPADFHFDFTASIDPESGAEVGTYFIYTYDGVPSVYYAPRDISLTISPPADKRFYFNGTPSGVKTVIVTGFDGYRESAISDANKIILSFP